MRNSLGGIALKNTSRSVMGRERQLSSLVIGVKYSVKYSRIRHFFII